jgi:hypothetical protein
MELVQLLKSKTREYKSKSFDELVQLVDKVQCFTETADGKAYDFEIHVERREVERLFVMIEASRSWLFLSISSRQIYFTMQRDGTIEDLSGDEYWS